MDTRKVCQDALDNRIEGATELINRANDCLRNGDYFQCAVRLQELENYGRFTDMEMNIFDSMNSEGTKATL